MDCFALPTIDGGSIEFYVHTSEQRFGAWIDWTGGDCPIVSEPGRVQVRYRRSGVGFSPGTDSRYWRHHPEPRFINSSNDRYDIIAYRIVN